MSLLHKVRIRAGRGEPQATVVMPLYNSVSVAGAAIASVLGQSDCVLEVVISDDASQDGTFEQAQAAVEAYRGPHVVRLFRAGRRLWMDHLPELIDRSACRLIIAAHGDDISLAGRMARLIAMHRETGASLITSLADVRLGLEGPVKPEGPRKDVTAGWLTTAQCVPPQGNGLMVGARYAFDRDIVTRFPRLDSRYAASSHDRVQAFRASLLGGVWYCDARLLEYRRHAGQASRGLADLGSAEASGFGWALRHLSALRTMGRDVDHAAQQGLIDGRRATALRRMLGKRMQACQTQLLDHRDALVRGGRQARWVTEAELMAANSGR